MPNKPPHHSHPHPPQPLREPARRAGIPASQVLGFIDSERLDSCLRPLVTDSADRAFVRRCLTGEGPLHHRGSNYILIALLGELLKQRPQHTASSESVPVPMRLPPHLADTLEPGSYPLQLPTAALRRLAGGDAKQLEAMIDCLTDGPPQHALANVALVALIEGLMAPPPPQS